MQKKKTKGDYIADVAANLPFIIGELAAFTLMVGFFIHWTLKKTCVSMANVWNNKKTVRSIFRLTGAGVGAYEGVVWGAVAGSFIPGPGTLIGAIVGGILGAGIGTYIAKKIARTFSYLTHRGSLNPTNPSKYEVSAAIIATRGWDTVQVNKALVSLKQYKNNAPSKEKAKANQLIKEIRIGTAEDIITLENEKLFLIPPVVERPRFTGLKLSF